MLLYKNSIGSREALTLKRIRAVRGIPTPRPKKMPYIDGDTDTILWQAEKDEKRILTPLPRYRNRRDTECGGIIKRITACCFLAVDKTGTETRHESEWQALEHLGYKLSNNALKLLKSKRILDNGDVSVGWKANILKLRVTERYRERRCLNLATPTHDMQKT